MGGLKRHLPATYLTFLIATLAIAGIPGLSGFFSKDEILWKAFSSDYGSPWLWAVGLFTAMLTAFYMFRLVFLTFFGEERLDHHAKAHLHESPKIMTVPLSILAVLSVIGGYIGIPYVLGGSNQFEKFLEPVMREHPAAESAQALSASVHNGNTEMILMVVSVALILLSIYLSYYLYVKNIGLVGRIQESVSGLYRLIYGKYFIDELYNAVIVRPLVGLSLFLWKIVDVILIDGLLNGLAILVGDMSLGVRRIQTGSIRTYTTIFLAGVIVIIGYFALR